MEMFTKINRGKNYHGNNSKIVNTDVKNKKGENMLLNKTESSKYLGVSIETLDRYKKQGKLGFVKIGDRCLWTKELLDIFIFNCTITAINQTTAREKKAIAKATTKGGAK